MLAWLQSADEALITWVHTWHTGWLSWAMVWLSDKYVWVPLYLLLVVLLYVRHGWRMGMVLTLGIVLTITLSDQLASGLLKPWVARHRPCYNPAIIMQLHLPTGNCGGRFGFVSSHAANVLALAAYLWQAYRPKHKTLRCGVFIWALLVAFSRVYLGVHYPSDILVGGLLGAGVGWLVSRLLLRVRL